LIMYWHIQDLWGPMNLVATTVAKFDDTPPYLMDVIGIVCGPPMDARQDITWKTSTRVRWAHLNSLIAAVNYGHSWDLHEPRVSCCQIYSLARCILIRISMTPLDMGEACSLFSNVVMELHYCGYENDDDDIDYFLVKA
jgi:hypothetical protein